MTQSINIDFSATNFARIDEPVGRIDTKDKKETIRNNVFKGGRNTDYRQELTVTYNVPTQKIPFLNWTSLRASYNTRYNWLASSLQERVPYVEVGLGNTLANTQTRTINGELKFEELYNKSRFLRAVNTSQPQGSNSGGIPPADNKKDGKKDSGKRDKGGKDGAAKDGGTQPVQTIPGMEQAGNNGGTAKPDTIRNKKGKIIRIKKPKKKKVKKGKAEEGSEPASGSRRCN